MFFLFIGDIEKSNKLTAKTKETKTKAILHNCNPVWEQQFILHGSSGLEGATALRIKIKDQGTGMHC
jgi:hypothetical protein